jgi:hypothetical protein
MRRTVLLFAAFFALVNISSGQCGANPAPNTVTISTASQIVNSYYPGTGNPTAGQNSLSVGSIDARGNAAAIGTGDLVLIIQMQGADLNTSNTDAYGNGVAGGTASGAMATNLSAGYYEYNTVSGVSGSTINFTYTLANNYYTQAYGSSTPTRTYQVIRVPRYYNLTINAGASVTAPAWNGSTGGVVVLDAAGVLTLNGSVNASALGFRGGGGKQFGGATAGNSSGSSALVNTDYRFPSAFSMAANTTGGAKGEGIAGTPVYTYLNGATSTQTGTAEGYIGGAMGRGAPANAGGGGTDGAPVGASQNQYNTGGGGGGNSGSGGNGGSGWHGGSGSSSTFPYGGHGGSPFAAHSLTRLIMGGGGGAGTANNSDGTNEYQSSGGAGGGIIISRAASYSGNGSVLANGGAAPGINGTPTTANTDAGGGGGAGGTIVMVTRQSGAAGLNSITASASGGKGGDMVNYYDHGPGGGGGGGIIYTNGVFASTVVTGGANGMTRSGSASGTVTNTFGASAGAAGQVVTLGSVPVLVNHNNIASPCGVLPVKLLQFYGAARNGGVMVYWQVGNATDFNRFEIEYSLTGSDFSRAGVMAFDNGRTSYEFLHLFTGDVIYYRLKLVNTDGTFEYSRIVMVAMGRAVSGNMVVYPNPAFSSVTMQVKWNRREIGQVEVINAMGQVVLRRKVELQDGAMSIPLNVEELAAGMYEVCVRVDEEVVGRGRMVKR